MLTLYSFIWSVLISSAFMLILHFLYKNDKIVLKFDPIIIIMILFCPIIRILFPLEFPGFQHKIGDSIIYAAILNNYALAGSPVFPIIILGTIWGMGSLLSGVYFLMEIRRFQHIRKKYSENLSKLFYEEWEKVKKDNTTVELKYLNGITSPMLAGLKKPTIYLPKDSIQADKIYYILLHEYTHWKEKDLWVKAGVIIFKVVFWWNPIIWLISRDLERFIEIRCDKNATANLNEMEKLCYAETMLEIARKNVEHPQSTYALGMSQNLGSVSLKQRFMCLLDSAAVYTKTSVHTGIVFTGIFALMVLSYYFLIQPSWDTPSDELWEEGTDFVADSSNSYLVKQPDGSYLFYMEDAIDTPFLIPKEDVEAGYYNDYPVKE